MEQLIEKSLDKAKEAGAHSIAFPTIGCGAVKFPPELVAGCFKSVVTRWQSDNNTYPMEVRLSAIFIYCLLVD